MYKIFWFLFSVAWAIESNLVIATIAVGDSPSGIGVTPDNRFAYIANSNNNGIPNGDSVTVLNLTYNTVERTIHDSSFDGPYTVTINAAGTIAYVANSNGTTVTMIDIAANGVIGTIPGFDGPSGFAISPDGKYAYVNNYGVASGTGHTVSVVDLNTNAIVDTVSIGAVNTAPAALAITPDGAYVYVVNYVNGEIGDGTVSIIRTSDNSVRANAISGLSGPFQIAITPNGQYAYVANAGSNNFSPVGTTVSVINLATNTIVDTITLGIQPSGIAITPDGSTVYVSNYNTVYDGAGYTDLTAALSTVNVISLPNNAVSPFVIGGVGFGPGYITIVPNGQFAYVSNFESNTVSVIRLPSPLYNINRMTQPYNFQQDETVRKLNLAGLM
jgi:YVTN family beta-propeller protein